MKILNLLNSILAVKGFKDGMKEGGQAADANAPAAGQVAQDTTKTTIDVEAKQKS